jgi:hypothetical protein
LEPHGFSFFTAVKISTTDGKVQEKKSMGVMAAILSQHTEQAGRNNETAWYS